MMSAGDVCVVSEDGPESLPLIVRPKDGNSSVEFIKRWVSDNKDWIDEKLLEHGAILFEGFEVNEGVDIEEILLQYWPDLCEQYRGVSPRKRIPGTKYVFSASEIAPSFPIPQHLELSFLPATPRRIFFCCLEAPTSSGGETCLCDFKKVYDQLDPGVRSQFEEKGVMYIRNYFGKKKLLSDPIMLKGWQDVFETSDKSFIEDELRREGLDFKWKKNDGLQITNREKAVQPHPVTGEKVWFNHAQVFHWNMIPEELYRVYKRLGRFRDLLLSWASWLLVWFLLTFLGESSLGFCAFYGDGSRIPPTHINHVRDVTWKNTVFNRWKKGDFVIIDNWRVSHGRQPFTGKRKIVVSWSQPVQKTGI